MSKKKMILCGVIYYSLIIISMFVNDTFITGYKAINVLAGIVTPLLIFLAFKIIKIKINNIIIYITLVFCGASIVMGNLFKFYQLWDPYDKILHCLSGVLIAILAYFIYVLLTEKTNTINKGEKNILLLFINCFNITIAFLWELFEFGLLVFFQIDSIRHNSTGVYDAMNDMIVCALGGIFISIFIVAAYRTKKDNWLTLAGRDFLNVNK